MRCHVLLRSIVLSRFISIKRCVCLRYWAIDSMGHSQVVWASKMRVLVAVERVCWQMSEVYIDFALGYVHDLGTLDWPISNEIGHICIESIKMEHLLMRPIIDISLTWVGLSSFAARFTWHLHDIYMTFTWHLHEVSVSLIGELLNERGYSSV